MKKTNKDPLQEKKFVSSDWTDKMLTTAVSTVLEELLVKDSFLSINEAEEGDPVLGSRIIRMTIEGNAWEMRQRLEDADIKVSIYSTISEILLKRGRAESWYSPRVPGGKNWK